MTIFDLIFIIVFLTCVVILLMALVAAVQRRRARCLALGRTLGVLVGVYLAIVILVSLVSPRRVLKIGEEQCWDDWCAVVAEVETHEDQGAVVYKVTMRISSRAGRRAQRGLDTHIYLTDDTGRRFDPEPDPDAIPFDRLLQPRESVEIVRTFTLPRGARRPLLVVSHGSGFPANLIIGESESLFHKRTAVQLP